MRECNKGFKGCPGKVPLNTRQCKSHRIYARMKSKMEASKGEKEDNSWIRAVNKVENVRHTNKCVKECCSKNWPLFQQVIEKGGISCRNIHF